MEKQIAFTVMVSLILVGIYFFNKGKLGSTAFATFTLGLIFLFIGFYSIDRIKEFNITGMKLVLSEMKDTKSNFDNRVNMLLEILAELNIDYTVSQGMWINAPIPGKLVKARNISTQMLVLTGKTKEEILKHTNIIDTVILGKYLGQLWRNIANNSVIFKKENTHGIEKAKTRLSHEIHEFNKGQAIDTDSLVKFLKSKGIEQELYKVYVADMEFYLKEHTLKTPSLLERE